MTADVIVEDARWTDLERLAQIAIPAALRGAGLTGDFEVAVMGCDDTRIAALNADLSWPSGDRRPDKVPTDAELGDIAIAFDTCKQEAAEQDKPFEAHVIHLLIHATLHLLGHDHQTDTEAGRMEALEVKILTGLGFPDPYASGRE